MNKNIISAQCLIVLGLTVVFTIKKEQSLNKPSKLFFEGMYEGFNFTPNLETINKVNRFNVNLTKLDESFATLGKSLIYPEKQSLAIEQIYNFFLDIQNQVDPQDVEGQYIINQHLIIFQNLETFQSKALRSFTENQISPVLFYWDAQDLFPYGLYKQYGINLIYTLKLMIFDD
ncbi:hypothetical protein ABPG72_010360 [Tetrahymena utriculariae]